MFFIIEEEIIILYYKIKQSKVKKINSVKKIINRNIIILY